MKDKSKVKDDIKQKKWKKEVYKVFFHVMYSTSVYLEFIFILTKKKNPTKPTNERLFIIIHQDDKLNSK